VEDVAKEGAITDQVGQQWFLQAINCLVSGQIILLEGQKRGEFQKNTW
jgi:hypothetical protein